MMGRKVMIKQPVDRDLGVCSCGHIIQPGEVAMGYQHLHDHPIVDEEFWYVCLTCHFWYVHNELSTA